MDMSGSISMVMSTITNTNRMTASSASSGSIPTSTSMNMGGMDMGGHGGHSCKISMLWNWNTVDSCFIAKSWHVRSTGAFAGTCIGMVLLVMVLEALRRTSKEYDAYIVQSRSRSNGATSRQTSVSNETSDDNNTPKTVASSSTNPVVAGCISPALSNTSHSFRPNIFQQTIRALLHMLQFAVAYFVMLMAMYYNGYVIICIFIGAFLGAFVFNWTCIGTSDNQQEVTYCCG